MTTTFDAAAVTAFVVYVCVAARRYGLAPSRWWRIGIAVGVAAFATLIYALVNGYADAPTWAGLGSLLLLLASQTAAGLGVFYNGGETFPQPPVVRREVE